jgi:hypothetical protein
MEVATGERIVAFGRVGKPLENPFFAAIRASIAAPGWRDATDFKAAWA